VVLRFSVSEEHLMFTFFPPVRLSVMSFSLNDRAAIYQSIIDITPMDDLITEDDAAPIQIGSILPKTQKVTYLMHLSGVTCAIHKPYMSVSTVIIEPESF
jgi:hypothetical protein